jgi:hypothetical protein
VLYASVVNHHGEAEVTKEHRESKARKRDPFILQVILLFCALMPGLIRLKTIPTREMSLVHAESSAKKLTVEFGQMQILSALNLPPQ